MLVVVAFGLMLSLLLLTLTFLSAFMEVAFSSPQPSWNAPSDKRWQPPFIHDQELFDWSLKTTKNTVRECLTHPRNAATACGITQSLYMGITQALQAVPQHQPSQTERSCASCSNQVIEITPPEAFAIVEAIRERHPQEACQIRNRAIANARRTAHMNKEQMQATQLTCPLLYSESLCAAHGQFPLHCRAWNASETPENAHKNAILSGANEGLRQELKLHGLDCERYELNSVLVAALDTPHAATRWAQGEGVFATCHHLPISTE